MWQKIQGMLYLIGSCCFTAGSSMYFTEIFHKHRTVLTAGGWLFTLGSLLYLVADLHDWWNAENGYCFDGKYHRLDVDEDHQLDALLDSSGSSFIHDEPSRHIELHVYGSMCGILFYLAGSILFIPIFEDYLTIGEWFFIFGSSFCSLSILWKMYRSAGANSINHQFRWINLLNDIPTLIMDICSLIGNICFFVGTILFLPYTNHADVDEDRAASFFVFGSSSFIVSSLCLQYTLYSSRSSAR